MFNKFCFTNLNSFVKSKEITITRGTRMMVCLGQAVPSKTSPVTHNHQYGGLDGWHKPLSTINNPYFGWGTYDDDCGGGLVSPEGLRYKRDHIDSILYRYLPEPIFIDTGLTCWQAMK